MNLLKTMLSTCVIGSTLALSSCSEEKKTKDEGFKYIAEEFADLTAVHSGHHYVQHRNVKAKPAVP